MPAFQICSELLGGPKVYKEIFGRHVNCIILK